MKPITFENLRRLMGGGKKKKEKEQSFKRSDSFKRISIRKSYLDRGGKKRQQQKLEKTEIKTQAEVLNSITEVEDKTKEVVKSNEGVGQSVIAYGNWLRGVRDTSSHVVVKGAERTIIYIPAADDPMPAPIIRQLSASPVLRKSPLLKKKSPLLKRKESNDSAVEMFPWGENVKHSPLMSKRSLASPPLSLLPDASEDMCSLSVSLGRIWMDAPLAMSPRSLELPRPTQNPQIPAHHSLDSALKDRSDPIKKKTPPVARTLSSTSTATASTGLFSSKDSGFSFSVSIPQLTDFNQPTTSKGFFRKKRPKPRLSVSREGYFKRTSGALLEMKRNSVKRKSSRKKKLRNSGRKKKNKNNLKNDMYQVVVSRPPRSLRSLKLDPMIFVPPEKRKPSMRRSKSFKLGVQEIRECTIKPPSDSDEGLYESISGELSSKSVSDHYYDVPSNELQSNGSSASLTVSPVVSEDDTSVKSSSGSTGSCYMPAPRNRPIRRKKSLCRKKSITYVAKPSIMRAPSTLRRSKKKKSSKYFHGYGLELCYGIYG